MVMGVVGSAMATVHTVPATIRTIGPGILASQDSLMVQAQTVGMDTGMGIGASSGRRVTGECA
jgi:hypothetical protein